ncbi:hypothetical protein D9M70_460300 [compost metagenome]
MGGGDHPHVQRLHLVGAERLHFLLLQHAEHLGLQGERQVADLVEEQGAAIGQFELAGAATAIGAGEGAGGGAEQFGLHQGFRDGRHVHRDEGPVGPQRQVVDALGQ